MSSLNAWGLPLGQAPSDLGSGAGKVVLVSGGRQGVGVSTVAALLALVAADDDVLLVDAADHGTAHRLFGVSRPESVAGTETVETLPTPVFPNLAVLALDSRQPRAVARRIAQLRVRFALTVVDGGSRLSTALEVGAAGIDHLFCVTTTDSIASAGAYAVVKALNARHPGLPVGVLVNRAPLRSATDGDHALRQAAIQFLQREIELIGQVPMDECLCAGVRAGMAIHEAAAGSPAALALHEVAQNLRLKQTRLSPTVFAPRPSEWRS